MSGVNACRAALSDQPGKEINQQSGADHAKKADHQIKAWMQGFARARRFYVMPNQIDRGHSVSLYTARGFMAVASRWENHTPIFELAKPLPRLRD